MTDLSAIHITTHRELQPKVGISACLAGQQVRYDGDHKYHDIIMRELGPWLDLQVFCPEVSASLGTPRPPVHLVNSSDAQLRAIGVEDPRLDVTDALNQSVHQFVAQRARDLCAYIVKSRSPSCGSGSTPIGNETGPDETGDGLLVKALKAACPALLIIEESQLDSAEKCREFLEQCYLLSER